MIYGDALNPGTGNPSSLLPPSFTLSSYRLTLSVRTAKLSPLLTPLFLSLSSLLPSPGSCRFSIPSSLSVSPPSSSPLLLNCAHHPRGIPTFLTAATAFIPSNVSGRAYKAGPEFNKSDNVRVFRDI